MASACCTMLRRALQHALPTLPGLLQHGSAVTNISDAAVSTIQCTQEHAVLVLTSLTSAG